MKRSFFKKQNPGNIVFLGVFHWRARHDSNVRPTESESVALSNWATGACRIDDYSIAGIESKELFPSRQEEAGSRLHITQP